MKFEKEVVQYDFKKFLKFELDQTIMKKYISERPAV